MWKMRNTTNVQRLSWLRRLYLNPAIGEVCAIGANEWTVAIDIAAPVDTCSEPLLYEHNSCIDWLPKNRFLRTTSMAGSIVVNAVRTGFTTVVASWVHSQSFYNGGGEILAFFAAVLTYSLMSAILWITIGYGGSAISSNSNIVLDVEASEEFCSRYLGGMPDMLYKKHEDESTLSFSPLISLEFDNTLLVPMQNMYCVKQILCLTKGPLKPKLY